MAQQHGPRTAPFAFVGIEQPAELRLNPQHLEKIIGYRHAAEPLRFSLTAEDVVADSVESEIPRQRGKGLVLLSQVEQVTHLRSLAGETASLMIRNPHQALRFVERQRP